MVLPVASARARQLPKHRMWSSFDLAFSIDQDGHVKVPLTWQAENLVTIKLPVPTRITTSIRVHKRAAPVFEAWFRSFGPAECACILKFGGSFVPRLMRGAKNLSPTTNPTKDWAAFLSRHSRGIALDFNPLQNPMGKPGAGLGETGCLWPIIEKARAVRVPVKDPNGFEWDAGISCGADWSPSMRDDMHFELGTW